MCSEDIVGREQAQQRTQRTQRSNNHSFFSGQTQGKLTEGGVEADYPWLCKQLPRGLQVWRDRAYGGFPAKLAGSAAYSKHGFAVDRCGAIVGYASWAPGQTYETAQRKSRQTG